MKGIRIKYEYEGKSQNNKLRSITITVTGKEKLDVETALNFFVLEMHEEGCPIFVCDPIQSTDNHAFECWGSTTVSDPIEALEFKEAYQRVKKRFQNQRRECR